MSWSAAGYCGTLNSRSSPRKWECCRISWAYELSTSPKGEKNEAWVIDHRTRCDTRCADNAAPAAADPVVIGDIDDLSGVYADAQGQGGIEAINMAIADFGGSVLGRKIV